MAKKRKKSVGQQIVEGLKEFTKVLESGEPLEDHFRVTTIERVNKWETVRTVRGPNKKKRH